MFLFFAFWSLFFPTKRYNVNVYPVPSTIPPCSRIYSDQTTRPPFVPFRSDTHAITYTDKARIREMPSLSRGIAISS